VCAVCAVVCTYFYFSNWEMKSRLWYAQFKIKVVLVLGINKLDFVNTKKYNTEHVGSSSWFDPSSMDGIEMPAISENENTYSIAKLWHKLWKHQFDGAFFSS
jgi:hypothetical protein